MICCVVAPSASSGAVQPIPNSWSVIAQLDDRFKAFKKEMKWIQDQRIAAERR